MKKGYKTREMIRWNPKFYKIGLVIGLILSLAFFILSRAKIAMYGKSVVEQLSKI